MTRAVVIKTYGDRNIGNAIADALTPEQMSLVKREYKCSLSEAAEGVKKHREMKELQEDLKSLQEEYGSIRPLSGPSKYLMVAYAMICYAIDVAFKKITAVAR